MIAPDLKDIYSEIDATLSRINVRIGSDLSVKDNGNDQRSE